MRGELDILKIEENSTVIVFYVSIWGSLELCLGGCCKLSVRVALNVRFTTNGICAKNHTHIYVARTSNNRMIMACDLSCCLLPQCEALRTCLSGFPVATGLSPPKHPVATGLYAMHNLVGVVNQSRDLLHHPGFIKMLLEMMSFYAFAVLTPPNSGNIRDLGRQGEPDVLFSCRGQLQE